MSFEIEISRESWVRDRELGLRSRAGFEREMGLRESWVRERAGFEFEIELGSSSR